MVHKRRLKLQVTAASIFLCALRLLTTAHDPSGSIKHIRPGHEAMLCETWICASLGPGQSGQGPDKGVGTSCQLSVGSPGHTGPVTTRDIMSARACRVSSVTSAGAL